MCTANKEKDLLERQYKYAIEARDKLNENYHKWMTYYYIANGAILVAITSIFSKDQTNKGILLLSTIGIFICILWNLSCKGYYYWSKSWINIIIALENRVIDGDSNLGVFSVFSEKTTKEDNPYIPNQSANISTPKLTLLFSFTSIISWIIFSIREFLTQYSDLSTCTKAFVLISVLIFIIVMYTFILPKFAKSRVEESHTLI